MFFIWKSITYYFYIKRSLIELKLWRFEIYACWGDTFTHILPTKKRHVSTRNHIYPIIESTKTRVNPGFFRGTPPGKPGFVPRFLPTPRFFPQYSGGVGHPREFRRGFPEFRGKFGNSGGVSRDSGGEPRNSGVNSGIPVCIRNVTCFSMFLH